MKNWRRWSILHSSFFIKSLDDVVAVNQERYAVADIRLAQNELGDLRHAHAGTGVQFHVVVFGEALGLEQVHGCLVSHALGVGAEITVASVGRGERGGGHRRREGVGIQWVGKLGWLKLKQRKYRKPNRPGTKKPFQQTETVAGTGAIKARKSTGATAFRPFRRPSVSSGLRLPNKGLLG